jgi:hypothetical protein
MAYSYVAYTGNGSTTQFAITFPYVNQAHIKVYVNYVDTAYTYANSTTIQLATAPTNGHRVEVRRVTPINSVLVDYTDGATLVAADLDTTALQNLYLEQELDDNQKRAIYVDDTTGLMTAGSQRITNVANPTAAQDAATKLYVDTVTLAGNVPDGDRGDITVSGVGTTWTIDAGAVTSTKILDGTILNADVNASAGIVTSKLSFTQAGTGAVARTVDSRLKDFVSVKDFGAVGDGVTNDTTAINAALATGKNVYFPQGTYATTGNHTIATNGQGITGDGAFKSIIKKLSGTSEILRVARLTNGCSVGQIGFDCNALAGTTLRWKSHYSFIKDIRITNGVDNQWGLHLTGVNVSYFEGIEISGTGGCILIDQNNDTDPSVGYSLLYSRFRNLVLVPRNIQALKIEGMAQDVVFDGMYVEGASTVVPNPPAIIISNAGPITDIHFYNIGCEHNTLQSTFIDITGTSTAQNDIYNICFRGGRLTAGFAGQDKPLIRANKVNNLIVDGLLFYCDQNLLNRPHIELTNCTNVKVVNNSVYSYPNDFIFIKDIGGCDWVTDDTNTRIRINASGGGGTNQWGLTSASSNISSINSGMAQTFTTATKVTSTDYQLAPSIRAYRNSAASLAHNVLTKWAFSFVDAGYDPSGCYNTSTYRFTPTVKGFYSVSMKGALATGGSNVAFICQIQKNGSTLSSMVSGGTGGTGGDLAVSHTDFVIMNGTTDYLEGCFYQYDYTAGASKTVDTGAFITSHFVRSI